MKRTSKETVRIRSSKRTHVHKWDVVYDTRPLWRLLLCTGCGTLAWIPMGVGS